MTGGAAPDRDRILTHLQDSRYTDLACPVEDLQSAVGPIDPSTLADMERDGDLVLLESYPSQCHDGEIQLADRRWIGAVEIHTDEDEDYAPPTDPDRRLEYHAREEHPWDPDGPAAHDLADVAARYFPHDSDRAEVVRALAGPMARAGMGRDCIEQIVRRAFHAAGARLPSGAPDLIRRCWMLHDPRPFLGDVQRWHDVAPRTYDDVAAVLTPDGAAELYDALDEAQLETALRARIRRDGSIPLDYRPPDILTRAIAHEVVRPALEAARRGKVRRRDWDQRIHGVLLGALLDGEDIAVRDAAGELANNGRGKPLDRDRALRCVMAVLASLIPRWVPWEPIAYVIAPSLIAGLHDGETAEQILLSARSDFTRALRYRLDEQEEREAAEAKDRARAQRACNAIRGDRS